MIAAILLVLSVVAYRVAAGAAGGDVSATLANFSPLAALALCCGVMFPKKWAIWVPVAAQIVSDVILHVVKPHAFDVAYSAVLLTTYILIASAGIAHRGRFSFGGAMLGAVGATLLFHIVLNTASFFYDPGYIKTFGGWIQSQTVGLPGYVPTWVFFLKSLAGNLLFSVVFLVACGLWNPFRLRTTTAAHPISA